MSTIIETPIVERAEAAFEDFVAEAERILAPTLWDIGRIASECKEITGKTDAELGERIGLSGSQVAQRRYVWDMFAADFDTYQNVSWSHFYAALKWDDALEVLAVANSEGFSVAEMVRYRNIRSGKTTEPEPAPTLDASHVPETKEKPLAQPSIRKVTAATRKTKPETSGGEATIASQVPPDEEQPPQTSDGTAVAPNTDDPLAGLIATIDRLVDAVADDCEKRKKIANELRRFADRMDPPPKQKTQKQKDAEDDRDFDEFYSAYPRQVARGQARRAYKTAKKRVGAERIHKATVAFATSCEERLRSGDLESPNFIPHPSTWLNGERWDDEPDNTTPAVGKTERGLQGMADWLNESVSFLEHGHEHEDTGEGRIEHMEGNASSI